MADLLLELPVADQARLAPLAEQLLAASGKPAPMLVAARAYVAAVAAGLDPVRAIGRAIYGPAAALYEGDATWLDESFRRWSRTWYSLQDAREFDDCRIAIPVAGGVRG